MDPEPGRRWRESGVAPVTRPAWLTEASDHIRANYGGDGLSEAVLWALWGAGFGVVDGAPEPPGSDEDVMEPLRRVVCP